MIPIGISACLTGEAVRFDGRHKFSHVCMNVLSKHFTFSAFCPEVAIGLGVPRKPIRLLAHEADVRAVGVEDPSADVTAELQRYAHSLSSQLAGLNGYIFTARSPSCGLNSTDLYSSKGDIIARSAGIFAAEVQKIFPLLPVVEASCLADDSIQQAFIESVYRYHNK